MSEFMREALPIIVMYGFVLLLAPFIGYAMWIAFDGDRLVDAELPVEADAPLHAAPAAATTPRQLTAAEATPAA